MPSPVGHLLAGAAIYLAATARERRSRTVLAIALLGSIAADFDFLPGILIGDMRAFHHGMSHSLAFALLFGGLMFLVAGHRVSVGAIQMSMIAAMAYSAHVLLDFVSVNEGTRGVPLFWPLSRERLGVSLRLFGKFEYGDITDGIWSVVRWDNVLPLLSESAILGALAIIIRQKEQIRQIFLGLRTRNGSRLG
jgi:membrane-bound metal-dependent hydrolase YbcI (DUF457 family)